MIKSFSSHAKQEDYYNIIVFLKLSNTLRHYFMKNGRLRAHLCLFGCFVCLYKQLSFSNHSKSLRTFCVDNCTNIIMLTNLCVCFRCIVWVVCLVYKYYLPDVAECRTCIQIHLNILILLVAVIFYIRCKILQNLCDIYHIVGTI